MRILGGTVVAAVLLAGVLGGIGCRRVASRPRPPAAEAMPAANVIPAAPAAVAPEEPVLGAADGVQAVLARQEEEAALLRQSMAERNEEVEVLRQEVQRLQAREVEMEAAISQLRETAGGSGAASAPDAGAGEALAAAQAEAEAARQQALGLQDQLVEERRKREVAQAELQRLKEETSTAPLAPRAGEADALTHAHGEIDELRHRLEQESAERERLANQLVALQAQANSPAPPAEAATGDADTQAQLSELQAQQGELVASAKRDLDASRQREAELESQLAAAQQEVSILRTRAAQVAVPVSTLEDARQENATLRKQVDEARKRNQDLSAKLETAQRVAELIFKMRAGEVEAVKPTR